MKLATELKTVNIEGKGFSRKETTAELRITFDNGYETSFSYFVNEVSNSRWASFQEITAIRKTTSLKNKYDFAAKYAEQFINVSGRKF